MGSEVDLNDVLAEIRGRLDRPAVPGNVLLRLSRDEAEAIVIGIVRLEQRVKDLLEALEHARGCVSGCITRDGAPVDCRCPLCNPDLWPETHPIGDQSDREWLRAPLTEDEQSAIRKSEALGDQREAGE